MSRRHGFFGGSRFVTLVVVMALATVVLPGAARAQRERGKEFATGSGKADVVTGIGERVAFTAQSTTPDDPRLPLTECAAKGSIVYASPTLRVKADVTQLVIMDQGAFIGAVIRTATDAGGNPVYVEGFAWLDVTDAGAPGPTGDLMRFQLAPETGCFVPLDVQFPVRSGNIVVKGEGLIDLP